MPLDILPNCLYAFTGLRRHQAIQFCILRKLVCKRYKRTTHLDKSVSCINIRDIRKLKVRYIQKFCKFQSVGRSLIEHNDKLAVRKHCSCSMALQKVVG